MCAVAASSCPVLVQGFIPCESSLDCPTGAGCGPTKTCSTGVSESVLTIEPAKAAINAAGTVAFVAKLDGQPTTSVNWVVEGTGQGTIDGAGLYTAPATLTTPLRVTVWASLKRHAGLNAPATVSVAPPDTSVAWVMAYFENGPLPKTLNQDSVHLAYSRDGYRWAPLAPMGPVFRLQGFGSNHLRDPFVFRKQDGTFVLLASDWTRATGAENYWSSPSPNIVVVDSVDLITFTNPRLLQLTTTVDAATGLPMYARAPQAFYDVDRDQYGILWTGDAPSNVNRIYVSYTSDFVTIASGAPTVFFDPGYSVSSARLVRTDSANFLLFRDDTDGGGASATGGDLQIARSVPASLRPGGFTRWSPEYITRGADQDVAVGTAAPFIFKAPQANVWTMCAELTATSPTSMGCWVAMDLNDAADSWFRLGDDNFSMPVRAQHPSVARITQVELDALLKQYGSIPTVKIKSTYADASAGPFYLVHSWYRGIITFDSDTAGGQLASDFPLQIWPSLTQSADTSLVSIACPSFPDYWLRVSSQMTARWPSGDALTRSNQSQYLSQIPPLQQHHLLWLDQRENTPVFSLDATYKMVPALNKDPSMVSFLWCGESKDGTCNDIADPRYLCYSFFQVFAYRTSEPCGVDATHPQTSAGVLNAMSFSLVNIK